MFKIWYKMHIKKIVINGFKSFKNKTILELGPELNVIIGRNGAGKTNLFCAIQFVLSHDYHHLDEAVRRNMLHSSSGLRATAAYVEITFDNEDNRFHDEEKELKLRREITPKTDKFFVNDQLKTKEQVVNILQGAGLAKTNPYYIINQGKITNLAKESDERRLAMLTEIAGGLVWKELRPKDEALLKDSELSLENFELYVREFEEKVESLEEEHEDYQQYLVIETKKDAVEACLLNLERDRILERLAYLRSQLEEYQAQLSQISEATEMGEINAAVTEAKSQLECNQAKLLSAQTRLKRLTEMTQELATEKSKLEFEILDRRKESEESAERPNENEESMMTALRNLVKEIADKRGEIADKSDALDASVLEQLRIGESLAVKEQRRQLLCTRLGRADAFNSVLERDQWIEEEQSKLETLIEKDEQKLQNMSDQISPEEESSVGQMEQMINSIEESRSKQLEKLVNLKRDKEERKREQKRLQMQRNEKRREEREVQETLDQSKIVLDTSKAALRMKIGNLMDGIISIESVIKKMESEGEGSLGFETARSYHGLFIDQFTCYEPFNMAIAAVTGPRLFYHIVNSEKDATEIIDRADNEQLPGDFKIFSVNRLTSKNTSYTTPGARPLMSVLNEELGGSIEEGMEIVMEQVFGRVILCDSLNIAKETAKECRLNANFQGTFVSLQGHVVQSNGLMTGGYIDPKRVTPLLYKNYKEARNNVEQGNEKLQKVQNEIKVIDGKFIEVANELQAIDMKIGRFQVSLTDMDDDLLERRGCLTILKKRLQRKVEVATSLKISIEANRSHIETLEQERDMDFITDMSEEDRLEVDLLNQEIDNDKQQLRNANADALAIELEKSSLESQLNDHLLKKKEDLEKSLEERSVCSNTTERYSALGDMESQFESLESILETKRNEIGFVEKTISELIEKIAEGEKELERSKNRRQKHNEAMDKEFEKISSVQHSIQRYEDAKQTILKKIEEQFFTGNRKKIYDDYSKRSEKELKAELSLLKKELDKKNKKGINHAAPINFQFMKEMLEKDKDMLEEMKTGQGKCEELIEGVDSQKNGAIQYSLMQIAKSFRIMFRTLVPLPATGNLKWIYNDDDSDSESEEDDDEPREPDLNRLTKVALEVSFTGGSNTRNLKSLSGGQQSVISMALVFAILMVDRAPFYLLDEADMALDPVYCKKIAETIATFAKRSQFIATTFRDELLIHVGETNIIGVFHDERTQTSHARSITRPEAEDILKPSPSSSISSSSIQK